MQHICWLFSIDANLKREADRNRFAVIELMKPDNISLPTPEVLAELGRQILAVMILSIDEIRTIWKGFIDQMKSFGRMAEVYALPMAVYGSMTGQMEEATEMLIAIVGAKQKAMATEYMSDEEDLIDAIITLIPRGCDKSVGTMLNTKGNWPSDDAFLGLCGIRKLDGGNVFVAHNELQSLIGGKWVDMNLLSLLRRITGAKDDKQRINKVSKRGITVPIDQLIEEDPEDTPSFATPPQAQSKRLFMD